MVNQKAVRQTGLVGKILHVSKYCCLMMCFFITPSFANADEESYSSLIPSKPNANLLATNSMELTSQMDPAIKPKAFEMEQEVRSQYYHRDFWATAYHGGRLSYCMFDGVTCGMKVANQYCHLMGYEKASRAVIEYNVGLTNYLASNSSCRGWGCHGFNLIECSNKIIHKPEAPYYYRLKKFAFPRFEHYRVDWCLEKNKHCGRSTAYSFCRRLGYMKEKSYKKETGLPATKTLGTHELCFGSKCSGFKEIICYR